MLDLATARACLAGYRIGVVGQRAIDFLAISRLAAIEVFVVCEGGSETKSPKDKSRLISPELLTAHRPQWTNLSIGALAALAGPHLTGDSTQSTPLHLLAYASSAEWEHLAAASNGGIRVVAAPAAIKSLLDDKVHVREKLSRIGIPVPISTVVETRRLDFRTLVKELGLPFIVQQPVSSSGIGTYCIGTEDDLDLLKTRTNPGATWLVSAYAGKATLNIHGLVLREDVIDVAPPSVQLTGVPRLSASPTAYCGNDFSAIVDLPASALRDARSVTESVGRWLWSEGYLGLFGIDLVVDGSEVRVVEVNPRLQGSTWVLGELEYERQEVPLIIKHFLGLVGHPVVSARTCDFRSSGAHAILHSRATDAVRLSHRLESGIFSVGSGREHLVRRRDGVGLLDLRQDEFLLYGLPCHPQVIIEPGAVMARIATRERLADDDGRALTPFGRRVFEGVDEELRKAPLG